MRSSETVDAESVRSAIVNSFSKNQYPGDSQLVQLDPAEDPDSEEIFERLQNKNWQELLAHLEALNGSELYWYSGIYSLMTPESFYYYLPAFLIVAMDLDRTNVVGTTLIFYLSRPETLPDYHRRYMSEVTARLSLQQRAAIQKWVCYLIQHFPEFTEVDELRHWL